MKNISYEEILKEAMYSLMIKRDEESKRVERLEKEGKSNTIAKFRCETLDKQINEILDELLKIEKAE